MIISFNPSIFRNQDTEIQDILAKILIILLETDIHFIDFKSINFIFYDENGSYIFNSNSISEKHLSFKNQNSLKDLLGKRNRINITSLHEQYLTRIIVGVDMSKKEIHPESVYRMIKERSKIIVENGINDWKFIQGICQKYSGSRAERGSIYKLVDKSIKGGAIEAEGCGGIGEIKKVTERWINDERYKNIFKYKLMAIFDSDRKKPDELPRHKKAIEYFKKRNINNIIDHQYEVTDLILWHSLYKKKIENYVPLNVLLSNIESINQDQKDILSAKTNEELDFIEYTQTNIGIGGSQVKDQFPKLFLCTFSHHDFEERCKHHKVFLAEAKENVSEIEQILLKIAKIL